MLQLISTDWITNQRLSSTSGMDRVKNEKEESERITQKSKAHAIKYLSSLE